MKVQINTSIEIDLELMDQEAWLEFKEIIDEFVTIIQSKKYARVLK